MSQKFVLLNMKRSRYSIFDGFSQCIDGNTNRRKPFNDFEFQAAMSLIGQPQNSEKRFRNLNGQTMIMRLESFK